MVLIFKAFFNTVRPAIFPQFGSYLRQRWSDLYKNFIREMYLWSLDKEVPMHVGSHLDPESWSGSGLLIRTVDLDQIHLGRGLCSSSAIYL